MASRDDLCCMTPQERGAHDLANAGYATGGGVSKRNVVNAIRSHETAQHGGKHSPVKLAGGGQVPGERSSSRPDRKGKGNVTVNVIVAKGGDDQPAPRPVMPMGRPPMPMPPPGPPPGAPPMAGPPPGMMPGPGPGMVPPGPMMPRPPMPGVPMRANGGTVRVRAHERRRAGGAV